MSERPEPVGSPIIRALEIGFTLIFLVSPILISTLLKEVFNTPKDILVGCVTVAMVAVLAVEALSHQRLRLPRSRGGWCVLGFLAWAGLSLLWSSDIAVASRDLGYHAALVALFVCGFVYGREEERVDNLLHFPIAAGVLAAGFGLMQYYNLDERILPMVQVWPLLLVAGLALGAGAASHDGPKVFLRPAVGLALLSGVAAGMEDTTVPIFALVLIALWIFLRSLEPQETILTLAIRALVGVFALLLGNMIDPQLLLVLTAAILLDESARAPEDSAPTALLAVGLMAAAITGACKGWDLSFLVLPSKADEDVKIYSLMGHRNYLAGYLIAVLPLAIVRMIAAWCVVPPGEERNLLSRIWKVGVYLSAVTLMLVCLINTHTRGAWFGGIGSLLFLVCWLLVKYRGFRLRGMLAIVLGATALIIGLFGWKRMTIPGLGLVTNPLNRHDVSAGARMSETLQLQAGSAFQRALIYRTAWWIIFDHPINCLMGTGIGTFGLHYMVAQKHVLKQPQNRKYVEMVNKSIYSHNEYWHYWSETGLVGLLLLFGGLFFTAQAAHRRLREEPPGAPGLMFLGMCSTLVATLGHNFFTFDFHLSYTGSLFYAVAGMVLAQADGAFWVLDWSPLTEGSPAKRRTVLVAGLFLVVMAIVPMVEHLAGEAMRDHYWRDGFLKFRARRFEEAFLDFEKAVAADPTRGEVLFDFGRALMDSGRNLPAIKVFEQAKATFVDPANDHNIALCYYKEGRLAEAEAHYKKALDLNEIYEQSLANLSYLYISQGRDDEAMTLLETGRKYYPGNPSFPTSIGVLMAKKGKFPEAKVAFEAAVAMLDKRKEPKASVLLNAGTVYYNLGELDNAEKAYLRAIQLEPEDQLAKQKLAMCQLAKWGKKAKEDPNNLDVRRNYALSLLAAGHAGPAAAEARNILDAYPEDAVSRFAYGRALELLGHRDDAMREFKRLERELPAGHELAGRVAERIKALESGVTSTPPIGMATGLPELPPPGLPATAIESMPSGPGGS